MAGSPPVRRVTRDVDPAGVQDLIDRPPRATVAFVRDGSPDLLPARVRSEVGRWLFAVAAHASPPLDRQEVVLVIDDGPYWFQLRGLSVRGRAARLDPAPQGQPEVVWYGIDVRRMLAWDYGAVREE